MFFPEKKFPRRAIFPYVFLDDSQDPRRPRIVVPEINQPQNCFSQLSDRHGAFFDPPHGDQDGGNEVEEDHEDERVHVAAKISRVDLRRTNNCG